MSHMIWYPDNVLAAEFNFYGPRIASLHYYLSEKAAMIYTAEGFDLLLKKNAVEELKRLDGLRVFSAKLQRSGTDLLRQADKDLASALDSQMESLDADEVELTFKVKRKTNTVSPKAFSKASAESLLNPTSKRSSIGSS